MEINLYKYKQIVKSVRENVTLEEFYQILHTYKPTEFFNTMYSEKTPCWYITEYINANTVMYYANGWADKTPQKITIEKLYQSWSIEGINYTKFYTDKTQEEWLSPIQSFKLKEKPNQEKLEEASERIRKELIHAPVGIIPNFNDGFEQGVKWEQQQDKTKYSEEDMMKAVKFGELYKSESSKSLFEKRGTTPTEVLKKWFEQIKNK